MVVLVLFVAIFALLGITFLLFPSNVLRLHSSLMRLVHGDPMDQDDALSIDRWTFPWERWMLGSKSEYIRFGPQAPDRFPKMLMYFRLLGVGFLTVAFLAIKTFIL